MSCFVCNNRVFQSVVKVINENVKNVSKHTTQEQKNISLEGCNKFLKMIAELNCKNVSARYKKDVECEVELFDKIPTEPITVKNIKDVDCWMYQTCDYYEKDELFQIVKIARDWAKENFKFSKKEYEEALWG